GERSGLVADAFHQIAVATDGVGVVVAKRGTEAAAQESLGDGHPHAVTDSLAQRPGGDLDPGGVVARFGVAGGDGAPLTEVLEVVETDLVAGEMQHRV